jgi:hypothetical protein
VLTARATDEQEKAHARTMRVQVESIADCRGVEMPRRFHLDGRKVEIVESDDQWHGADYRYFKVTGDDGNFYILRFDEPSSEWDLTMFQRHMGRAMRGLAPRFGNDSGLPQGRAARSVLG